MSIFEYFDILPQVIEKIADNSIRNLLRRVPAVRLEFRIKNCDLIQIFQSIKSDSKNYWCNRTRDFESTGAVNIFDNFDLTEEAFRGLSRSGLRFYFSEKFDPTGIITEKWRHFGRIFVFLPLWSVERRGDDFSFILNYTRSLSDILTSKNIDTLSEFGFELSQEKTNIPKPLSIKYAPKEQAWNEEIELILSLIKTNVVHKIVPSRLLRFDFADSFSREEIFRLIAENSENSFNFYFQPSADSAFMGISPELLLKKDNNRIFCDVLAGTCRRTGDEKEDRESAAALLASKKEIEEHRIVARFIESKLKLTASEIAYENLEEIRVLKNLQHIYSSLSGKISADSDILQLVNLLSPTPAVCGFPRKAALEVLNSIEPYDRGHYAGALGCVFDGNAEVCVAIRSALAWRNRLYVYAGAGVVKNSVPEKEWDEIESKLRNFRELFN